MSNNSDIATVMEKSHSTRRRFLWGVAISGPLFFGSNALPKWAQASLLPTPGQSEGPFYPIDKPIDQDADLTFVGSGHKRASGELHIVQGRVFNIDGQPIPRALVEIWQANKWGRYQDHRDDSSLPWDYNFQGYGKTRTDEDGRYTFKTIKPAGYGQGRFGRTPHIHFKVNGIGFNELVTQMYFAGEPENNRDFILRNTQRKESVVVEFKPVSSSEKLGTFDLVLT